MIGLLKNELPAHYGLHRLVIDVPHETISETHFDLADEGDDMVVAYRTGNVSFSHESATEMEVINYECYLNGLSGTAFERGRKRCDYILYEKGSDGSFVLNEQTSALGTMALLSKPILDKSKTVKYPGGKYEKVEIQLSETLRTLMEVSAIAGFISGYTRRICLMSYVIKQKTDTSSARQAFSARYRKVESRETGEEGALLECHSINSMGFEYRRISHDYVFKLD